MKKNRHSNIAIIIPSYKETENIKTLIHKIRAQLSTALIVIVDDSSTKINTSLKKLLCKSKNLVIISRHEKQGRGSAVLEGFKKASNNKNIKYYFEMDADLSHDPREYSKFLLKVKETNADVIIGSRYLPQSQIVHWPIFRLVLSKIINKLIDLTLNLSITDYTNGFRLYNKQAVKFLIKNPPQEKGFIMLSETAYKLSKASYSIKEVPITFTDRKKGKSHAGIIELLSALWGLFRIKFL